MPGPAVNCHSSLWFPSFFGTDTSLAETGYLPNICCRPPKIDPSHPLIYATPLGRGENTMPNGACDPFRKIEVTMTTVLLLNGPNLGILGRREPSIYGTDSLADIAEAVDDEIADRGWKTRSIQHDSEGALVGAIQDSYDTVGAIVNPGALMIAGWSLRDALANYP